VHHDFTGHSNIKADNAMIANRAIVPNVRISHDQRVVPDDSFPFGCRSPVYGHVFANDGVVTYFNRCIFSFVFKILRSSGDYRARRHLAVFANPGTTLNIDTISDDCIVTNNNIIGNGRKISDANILSNPGILTNDSVF
jgi:hypothetical protein